MGAHSGHMVLRLADDAQIHRGEASDYGPGAMLNHCGADFVFWPCSKGGIEGVQILKQCCL